MPNPSDPNVSADAQKTIYLNTFSDAYEDYTHSLNQFGHLSAVSLNAFQQGSNVYDFTLGASANVRLEASENIRHFIGQDDSQSIEYYTTMVDSNVRTDTEFLSITPSLSEKKVIFSTDDSSYDTLEFNFNNLIDLNSKAVHLGTFTVDSSSNGNTAIGSECNYLDIDTALRVREPTTLQNTFQANSTATFLGHSYFKECAHFECNLVSERNLYAKNVNLYKDSFSNYGASNYDQHGYAFRMNENNQLELIKVRTFFDSNSSNADKIETIQKKVAVFGYANIEKTASADAQVEDYLAFNELCGQITTNSEITGSGEAGQSSSSTVIVGGDYIPLSGTASLSGDIIPNQDKQYDLGSASNMFKNVYGDKIYTHTTHTAGADYAERVERESASDVFQSGEIVGINADGKLTKAFSKSVHFGVISAQPGVVGNDGISEETSELVAFTGCVDVNVPGAKTGEYIIPVAGASDSISGVAKSSDQVSLAEYMSAVGHVIKVQSNGTPYIIVKH